VTQGGEIAAYGIDSESRAKHQLIKFLEDVGGLSEEWLVVNSKEKLNDRCVVALYSCLSLK